MVKKQIRLKKWIDKLLNRYRMVIINEKTFEEQLQFRLSRLNVIIFSSLVFILFGVAIFTLIAYTSIKEYIPGYDSTEIRKKATENFLKADSLITLYERDIQYLNSIKNALSGKVEFEDYSASTDIPETEITTQESITRRTKADSLLRQLVAQEDKYNINSPLRDSNINFLLFPPANGPLSEKFNSSENHYAVDIVLEENTPIKSIADGTVIFAEWSAQTGYVIMIEHPYGLLSVYKHNASLTKKQGDRVVRGEVIATAGNTGAFSTGWHLHFELWMDGYPIDPEYFFDF